MTGPERGKPLTKASGALALCAVLALAAALTLGDFIGGGGEDKIRWQPVAGSVAAARAGRKLLFYDFSAAWCPPCRRMERQVFSDPELAETISSRFVPVHVIDRHREEGRNPVEIEELQQRFRVDAFPTVVIATADGAECARFVGFRDKGRVNEFIQAALAAGGQD